MTREGRGNDERGGRVASTISKPIGRNGHVMYRLTTLYCIVLLILKKVSKDLRSIPMASSVSVPRKLTTAALLLVTVLLLGACAGSPSTSETESDSGPAAAAPRADGPPDLEVNPTAVADADPTPEPKAEPTPKGGEESTDTDKGGQAEAETAGRQTRSQPSSSTLPQTATEYTWRDGDRVLKVTLQPDLVLQDESAPTVKDSTKVETGKGVIVRKSDTSETSGQPVFRSPSGALMTLPGGVLLVVEDAWTEAEVNAFLARNGIKRDQVSELSYATNGFFVETDPGFPSLELANKLAAQKGVIIASPNWWTQVTTR